MTPHKTGTRVPNVVLLRVGIDKGSGGILGPIFKNRSFEFIPICSSTDKLKRDYQNTKGRSGCKLIEYFGGRAPTEKYVHLDPEFTTHTYGDPTRPKQSLRRLKTGDFLVLYAGLKGWNCKIPEGLYIVGYFVVKYAGTYSELKRRGVLSEFTENWHILNGDTAGKRIGTKKRKTELVLIKGGAGSRLLEKAVRISDRKRGKDRGGHPVYVLDPKMCQYFGNFTELNAIQRSIPRWVDERSRKKAAMFVRKLQ